MVEVACDIWSRMVQVACDIWSRMVVVACDVLFRVGESTLGVCPG